MSASDKLRALDQRRPLDAISIITRSFPQIVEVVEAAEVAYDGFGEDDHRFYGSQQRIVAALVALDEALKKHEPNT